MKRILISLLLTMIILNNCVTSAMAATCEYKITSSDTPTTIDSNETNATIDTVNNEIRLPYSSASVVSFWPDGGADFIVMTSTKIIHYSFNGSSYDENTVLEIVPGDTPTAVTTTSPFPDVKLATGTEIQHFSFDGSGMVKNSSLSKSGIDNAYTLSSKKNGEFVALIDNQAQRYMFDGNTLVRVTSLEPGYLETPIDAALFQDSFNMAVLESDKLSVYRWDKYGNSQSTRTILSEIRDTKDIDTAAGGDIAIVIGNKVSHYNYDGNNWEYNPSLSVTGLSDPKAVALRDGTFDKLILDGNQIKYYCWNGSSLVYDSSRSVVVPDIGTNVYRPVAVVQSQAINTGGIEVNKVKVQAYHILPEGTSVTWSVTADGINWVKKMRVRGTSAGTVCEVSDDNGAHWSSIGDASMASPGSSSTELWADVNPGCNVKWKAELYTSDPRLTPKIVAGLNDIAVIVVFGSPPEPPVIDMPDTGGACFTTTTPTLSWSFSDADGDHQSAYQLIVKRKTDGQIIYDSGKIESSNTEHTIQSSTDPSVPSALWNSGAYEFTVELKVWDDTGLESGWSNSIEFCVLAFERPRIAEIVSPPEGQIAPDKNDASTHIVITPGMTQDLLPLTKAGGKVVLLIDSIGPIDNITPVFPYGADNEATVNIPAKMPDGISNNPINNPGSLVNRWCIEFFTNASLEDCPNGTVVNMELLGNSPEGQSVLNAPPYSEGIIVTNGTVFDETFVVLQGRDN